MLSTARANQLRVHKRFGYWVVFIVVASTAGCNSKDGATPTASVNAGNYNSATAFTPEKPKLNLHTVVKVHTSAGDFTMRLDAEHSPLTVDNFLNYMKTGHYNGTIFHQVYDGFIVLAGGYDSELNLRPTESPVRNEAHNGLKNRRGTVAMARQADGVDSATSQFFFNLADNPTLDFAGFESSQYGYCVFGEVTEGMDVIDRISKSKVTKTQQLENVPEQAVLIESISMVEGVSQTR